MTSAIPRPVGTAAEASRREAPKAQPVPILPRSEIPPEAWEAAAAAPGPVPHYGAELHHMAAACRACQRPEGYPAEYDLLKTEFDFAYYLACYPDIAAKNLDPVAHYIRAGAREGRNPTPFFSTRNYRGRYGAEIRAAQMTPFGHWLSEGRAAGLFVPLFQDMEGLCTALGITPEAASAEIADRYTDLRARLEHGELGRMVQKAAEIDPLVEQCWPNALQVRLLPFSSEHVVTRIATLHRAQADAGFERARAVVVTGRAHPGLGPSRADHLVAALVRRYGAAEVMVVITDDPAGRVPAGRFAPGVRHTVLPSRRATQAGNVNGQERPLTELLRSLRPDVILNAGSELFWETLQVYGRVLADLCPLVAGLPGDRWNALGHVDGGWARRFYRHFDLLSAICVESAEQADAVAALYAVPEAQRGRITVMPLPVPAAPAPTPAAPARAAEPGAASARRPQIFWADRLAPDARPALLYAVANALPEADLRMWHLPGSINPNAPENGLRLPPQPRNLTVEGRCTGLADLPLGEADLWICTARPGENLEALLAVAAAGLPLVAAREEGLDPDLYFAVPQRSEAFADAVRAALADLPSARARAAALQASFTGRRSHAAHRDRLAALLERIGVRP